MPEGLEIALAPEKLDEGSPEERACFGLFSVRAGEVELTAGFNSFISSYRPGPLISGYHAACVELVALAVRASNECVRLVARPYDDRNRGRLFLAQSDDLLRRCQDGLGGEAIGSI